MRLSLFMDLEVPKALAMGKQCPMTVHSFPWAPCPPCHLLKLFQQLPGLVPFLLSDLHLCPGLGLKELKLRSQGSVSLGEEWGLWR